jgi:hypothetical protein
LRTPIAVLDIVSEIIIIIIIIIVQFNLTTARQDQLQPSTKTTVQGKSNILKSTNDLKSRISVNKESNET